MEPRNSLFVVEYADGSGELRQAVVERRPLARSVRRALEALVRTGVRPQDVRRVYFELFPGDLPGNYTLRWLRSEFPAAKVTWSFDYGATAQSRAGGRAEWRAAAGGG